MHIPGGIAAGNSDSFLLSGDNSRHGSGYHSDKCIQSNMYIPGGIAAGDSDSILCCQVITVGTIGATIEINTSGSNMHIPDGIAVGDSNFFLVVR